MMSYKKYFAYAKEIGFSDVEFKTRALKKLSISVHHGNVEDYQIAQTEVYSIRGIYNGNMVSATTENKANICEILDQMKGNAGLIEVKKEQEFFAGSEKYRRKKTYSDELSKVSPAEKIAMCRELEEKCYAYDERIKDTRFTSYNERETTLSIENTKGLKLSYKASSATVNVMAIARDGDDTRVGMEFCVGQKMSDFDTDALAKGACEGAVKALHGEQCKSGKYKTILHNDVFATLLSIFLSSMDGDAVNKGKSMLKDSLNQPVASRKLTVTEDPFTTEYPFMGRSFDDEGVATSKKALVENGVLKTFLYTMESAKEAGTVSTGNGYGASAIHAGLSYVSVKPGRRDLDALAASVKKGILITSIQGTHAGMNPISGNFSLQAAGYLIEDGKITTPVNLITVAGNLFEMFKDITDIGSDRKLSMEGIFAPSVVVKKLSVSGK